MAFFFVTMTKLSPILLIDGNNLAHANHHATKLTVGTLQVQAVFGFLKSLRSALNSSALGHTPIVLWDGDAHWRKEIYPDYKANRKTDDPKKEADRLAYKKQMPLLERALTTLGVMQIRSPKHEADDLAGHMLFTSLTGRPVTMMTGDQDWLQMVRHNVDWYDPVRDRRVTFENFFESTGYKSPESFVEGKALMGDSSDHVPGVGGIGEKGAPVFVATYGSVYKFFHLVDEQAPMKLGAAAMRLAQPEGRARFERNMKLVDLRQARKLEPGDAIINRGSPNPEAFRALCQRLAFASILREFPQFLASFGVRQPEPVTAD